MKSRILGMAYSFAASPRLTVALLGYAVFLFFAATLDTGLSAGDVREKYMAGFFCFANFGAFKMPIFGGAFLSLLAIVNIIASEISRKNYGVRGFGLSLTHISFVLLIISGIIQHFMMREGVVSLSGEAPSSSVMEDVSGTSKIPHHLTFSVRSDGEPDMNGDSFSIIFERGKTQKNAMVRKHKSASFAGWSFFYESVSDGKVVLRAVKNPARLLPWLAVGSMFLGMMIIFLPRVIMGGANE